MRSAIGVLVIVLCSMSACGCVMTSATQVSYWSEERVFHNLVGDEVMIYGGTFWDFALLGGWFYVGVTEDPTMIACMPLAILDLPFCVTADTVLLPMTIPQQIEVLLRDETSGSQEDAELGAVQEGGSDG